MKEITQFANAAGTPSGLSNALDSVGSAVDLMFAEAIIANEPTSVLEERGIVRVRRVEPVDVDKISFPIVRNTQFTWTIIDSRAPGSANELGSEFNAQQLNAIEYREVRPKIWTSHIFLPDTVSLANKVDFELFSKLGAVEAKRKKEAEGLGSLMAETNHTGSIRAAGGFVSNGSVLAASTLDPLDLVKAKRLLATGKDPYNADFVLVHPLQLQALNTHADFAPGATSNGAMLRKAKFDAVGDITMFQGMDVVTSELLPATTGSATTAYEVDGHAVLVGVKGLALGRGEKMGIRVTSQDDRLRHGTYKIFDMWFDHAVLVTDSMILLRTAD